MTHFFNARLAAVSLCLATSGLLVQGCTPQASWNGLYAIDQAGGARTCVVPAAASLPDGKSEVAQIQVSNEGGWCGLTLNRGGAAFDSYLMVTRPNHGRVFAHRVGTNTRIDYTPDAGFTGTDGFVVRLVPGGATIQGAVTVTAAK